MRRLITYSIMLLSWVSVYSQSDFDITRSIRDEFVIVSGGSFKFKDDENSINNLSRILKGYLPDSLKNRDLTEKQVLNILKSNPFFGDKLIPLIEGGSSLFMVSSLIKKSAISIGGLNVTNIADGLAKFLVERAKEELSISFFRKFKETLEDTKYQHLITLFANTANLLKTIDTDIYKFSLYLQVLRSAFLKDLNNLFETAPQAIRKGFLNDAFSKAEPAYLKELFLYAFDLAGGLKNGKHPGEIIEKFETIKPDNEKKKILNDINSVIQIVQLFSTSLKTAEGADKQYWVNIKAVKELIADPVTFKIYLGLVYQRAEGIKFSDNSTFQDKLKAAVSNVKPYEDLIRNGIEKFHTIQAAIDEIKDKKKSEISYSEYYDLFSSVTDMLSISDEIIALPGFNITVPELFSTVIELCEHTNQFLLDINLKQYSSGIIRLISIYDLVLKPAYEKYTAGNGKSLVAYEDFREKLLKYGTFIAAVAEANNSDEVKSAIEAAVLPVGSSSIKRESHFNISLNAYIGPFAASEYLPRLKKKQTKFSAGMTAPVGIALGWGKLGKGDGKKEDKKDKGGKSLSFFVPLIDIGAMAAYRFQDDSSEVASEVKLRNIISPGLYLYYGFGKCPVSLGFGAQIGPQLRKLTAKELNIDKNIYIRYGLSLVVDIPLFNFYTKPEKNN